MAHILFLEPNTVLAQTYARALQATGHSVACATSAQSAIDAADKQAPDLVIVELQLPAHGGIEFLHEFRSYPEWQHVPVVVNTVITPSKMVPVAEALARDLGVTTICYKPQTSLQELLNITAQALGA
ncbi:MAG TPA: response regulator [Patescibacteria group bacterium]|nr:response regulator [Patescibacteria group bacterium]